ncbi:MAG: CPBP family intramembrane metalloprotease [Acidobacteria bacterium]|nr:CPBP family intramembrane metalloprotease [Acidobacteriota bacterium]
MRTSIRGTIRAVALSIAAPAFGFLLFLLVRLFLKVEVPRLTMSLVNLAVAAFIAFVLFSRVFGVPFGKVAPGEFVCRIGLLPPPGAWKHALLGVVLAACTLGGMLAASFLTGRYVLNWDTLNLTHVVFSLNPGIWEEVFYRGVMMIALLGLTRSLPRAFMIQVVVFGLAHIKGVDLLAMVEVVSVMVIGAGFTYAVHKTNALLAAMIFHFLHDAFLFLVQLPDGVYTGLMENALFYALLWLMVGVGCMLTKVAADRWGVTAPRDLYRFPETSS